MLKKSSLQKFAKSPPLPFKNAKIQDRTTPVKSQNNPFAYEADSTKIRIEHLQNNLKQETKQRANQFKELLNMINDLKKENKSKCKHNILVMERSPTRQKISKADFANNASIASITSHKQRRDSTCGVIKEINSPIETFDTVENASSRFYWPSVNISKNSKKNTYQQQFQYVNERITALESLIQTNQKILEKLQQKNDSIQKMVTRNYQSLSRIFQSKIDQINQDNEVMIIQIEEKFEMQGKKLIHLQKLLTNLSTISLTPSNENIEETVLKLCQKSQNQMAQKIKQIMKNLEKYQNKNSKLSQELNKNIDLTNEKLKAQLKLMKELLQKSIDEIEKSLLLQIQNRNQYLRSDFEKSCQEINKNNRQQNKQTQTFNNLQHSLLVQKCQNIQNMSNQQKQQIQDLSTKLKDFINDIRSKCKAISQENMAFSIKMSQTEQILQEIKISNYKNDLKFQSLKKQISQNKSQLQKLSQCVVEFKEIIESKSYNLSDDEIETKQTIISNSITLIEENKNQKNNQYISGSQSSTTTEFYQKKTQKNNQSCTFQDLKLRQKITKIESKLQEFIFKWQYILDQKQEKQKQINQQKSLSSSRYQDDFFQSMQKRLFDTEQIVSELMKMTMMLTTNLNKISSSEKQSCQKNKNSKPLKMLSEQLKPIIQTNEQVSLQQIDISFTEQNSIQNLVVDSQNSSLKDQSLSQNNCQS